VPALATTVKVVVGPGRSRLAYLTPDASPLSYWKLPDAAAASPRLNAVAPPTWDRLARRRLLPSNTGEDIALAKE